MCVICDALSTLGHRLVRFGCLTFRECRGFVTFYVPLRVSRTMIFANSRHCFLLEICPSRSRTSRFSRTIARRYFLLYLAASGLYRSLSHALLRPSQILFRPVRPRAFFIRRGYRHLSRCARMSIFLLTVVTGCDLSPVGSLTYLNAALVWRVLSPSSVYVTRARRPLTRVGNFFWLHLLILFSGVPGPVELPVPPNSLTIPASPAL